MHKTLLPVFAFAFLLSAASMASGQEVVYQTMFSGNFPNGSLYGFAVVGGTTDKFLALTPAVANRQGAARLNLPMITYPTISFRLYTAGGVNSNGGKGVAFSYGGNIPNDTSLVNRSTPAVQGFGTGFVAVFKTANDSLSPPGVHVYFNGSLNGTTPRTPNISVTGVQVRQAPWITVTISFVPPPWNFSVDTPPNTVATLNIFFKDQFIVSNASIPSWNVDPSWAYVWSGSTSSSTDVQRMDNLTVAISLPPEVQAVVAFLGDPNTPDFIWQLAALEAAIMCVRGPPFTITIQNIVYRYGRPRARRLLSNAESTGAGHATNSRKLRGFTAPPTSTNVSDFYAYVTYKFTTAPLTSSSNSSNTTEAADLGYTFAERIRDGTLASNMTASFTTAIANLTFSPALPTVDTSYFDFSLTDYISYNRYRKNLVDVDAGEEGGGDSGGFP